MVRDATLRKLGKWTVWGALFGLLVLLSCGRGAGGAQFPWPAKSSPAKLTHKEVSTVNEDYDRMKSAVLVRKVKKPTRANLDFAAYHRNMVIKELEPESLPPSEGVTVDKSKVFDGVLEPESLVGAIAETTLSDDERAHPMAFPPLVDYLAKHDSKLSEGLEQVRSAVRSEKWGLEGGPHIVRQRATEAFLTSSGDLWVRVEFEPWFKGFVDAPDGDGDGYGELFGKVRSDLLKKEAVQFVRQDYIGKVLDASEVTRWANELASYWYPSYNTDIYSMGTSWPAGDTEAHVTAEVKGLSLGAPSIVIRGRPDQKALYNVVIVEGVSLTPTKKSSAGSTAKRSKKDITPKPEPVVKAIDKELKSHGGSWNGWVDTLKPYQEDLKKKLKSRPKKIAALQGRQGFLFYRRSLTYVLAGNLEKQKKGKNPIPAIVEFKELLANRGVDFLFVPIPTKLEVFPDKLVKGHDKLRGEIVQPNGRRLIRSLAKNNVEVVDVLPELLAARKKTKPGTDLLYQKLDTHWTDRGLRLVAKIIAERIKQYPWYEDLAKNPTKYTVKVTHFNHEGDLASRLPDAEQRRYKPTRLVGRQVVNPDGSLFEDVMESPITIIGDSFTGVYQRTMCEHAGVTAHIAKELSSPVDLVMNYGGGPVVRQKLLRRGVDSLNDERVVIWIMTARDLYDYTEDWELLEKR